MKNVHVQLLPSAEARLSGSVAVMIDVLRASTTMIEALSRGAASLTPCLSVEEARRLAAARPRGSCLIGGERKGRRIQGFDLDNSPASYNAETVSGKSIIFTTTNGTRALHECAAAQHVLIGAFINRTAVVKRLCALKRDVQLVCAGTDGELTAEDILFAGAVVTDLLSTSSDWRAANVEAQMAAAFFQARARDRQSFRETICESLGGKNLQRLGMEKDIEFAMQHDACDAVPAWDAASEEIRLLPPIRNQVHDAAAQSPQMSFSF